MVFCALWSHWDGILVGKSGGPPSPFELQFDAIDETDFKALSNPFKVSIFSFLFVRFPSQLWHHDNVVSFRFSLLTSTKRARPPMTSLFIFR